MRVRAAVDSVKTKERESGGKKFQNVYVSLEGFSVQVQDGCAVPEVGTEIDAVIKTRWYQKADGTPFVVHRMTSFQLAL